MDITEQLTHESRIALAAAAEITRLRAEVEALRADAARLDCGQIMIHTRNEIGEPKQVWHTGMNLRAAIDAAIKAGLK